MFFGIRVRQCARVFFLPFSSNNMKYEYFFSFSTPTADDSSEEDTSEDEKQEAEEDEKEAEDEEDETDSTPVLYKPDGKKD